jgi:hypothetical protein
MTNRTLCVYAPVRMSWHQICTRSITWYKGTAADSAAPSALVAAEGKPVSNPY